MQLLAVPQDREGVAAQAVAAPARTIVIAAAAAMAASTALPPFHSIRSPACAASGCEVETTLRANTGMRVVG